ncbi:hypothetical protein HDU76_000470, partial [Blyttiomyces sp. JEL0837]
MTYDLHGNWDWGDKWVGPYLNVHNNWTEIHDSLTMMFKAGVDSDKLLLGIGYYGRSFRLQDSNCYTPGECVYQDPGPINTVNGQYSNTAAPGVCSGDGGTLAYYEIADIIANNAYQQLWYDSDAAAKIMVYNNGQDCIGYDDRVSVADKLFRASA